MVLALSVCWQQSCSLRLVLPERLARYLAQCLARTGPRVPGPLGSSSCCSVQAQVCPVSIVCGSEQRRREPCCKGDRASIHFASSYLAMARGY